MKNVFALALLLSLPVTAPAQPATAAPDADELFAARRGEPQLFPRLRGVRFLAQPTQLAEPGFPADAVDATRTPLLDPGAIGIVATPFMDEPASQASLERLVQAVRTYLRITGRPFTSVSLPPQDVTGGYVQIVVTEARSEGEVIVTGAKRFSAKSYRAALHQAAGAPIDAARLADDLAWLHRNPYRQVSLSAEAGREPGGTRLVLDARERLPLALTAGFNNSGSRSTGENRVSVGFTWGNALGRGDLFNYNVTGDPQFAHLRSHSGGYTAFLPWRHVLSLQGAYSQVDSVMPEPFTQHGTSWQAGARYEIPLRAPREGWTQNLSFTADFKYSDNTLEFATIPVTDNATHVAQVGATYGVSFRKFGGQNSISLSGYASPGGLTRFNRTSAFNGSRPGAKAGYAYGKLSLSHARPLGRGFSWQTSADAQLASGALLGSEQLNGGGSSAVRGYRESSGFGDSGVVLNNELHAPGFGILRGRDRVDLFAFVDAASLNLNVDRESTDLRSAGLGLNYSFGRFLSVRASYGWQMKQLDGSAERARGHVSANVSF